MQEKPLCVYLYFYKKHGTLPSEGSSKTSKSFKNWSPYIHLYQFSCILLFLPTILSYVTLALSVASIYHPARSFSQNGSDSHGFGYIWWTNHTLMFQTRLFPHKNVIANGYQDCKKFLLQSSTRLLRTFLLAFIQPIQLYLTPLCIMFSILSFSLELSHIVNEYSTTAYSKNVGRAPSAYQYPPLKFFHTTCTRHVQSRYQSDTSLCSLHKSFCVSFNLKIGQKSWAGYITNVPQFFEHAVCTNISAKYQTFSTVRWSLSRFSTPLSLQGTSPKILSQWASPH